MPEGKYKTQVVLVNQDDERGDHNADQPVRTERQGSHGAAIQAIAELTQRSRK